MKKITSLSGLYILACWVNCLCSCNSNVQNSQDTLLTKDAASSGAIQNKDTANVASTSIKADTAKAPDSFTIDSLKKDDENKIRYDSYGSDGTIYLKGEKRIIGKYFYNDKVQNGCFRINGELIVFKRVQYLKIKKEILVSPTLDILLNNSKIVNYESEYVIGSSTIDFMLKAADKQTG